MTDLVKYHDSRLHTGLSAFSSDTAGSFLAQLKAVLCDGYNACTVASISRTLDVVTVNTTGAHNYVDGQVVVIGGVTPSDYNGEWRISVPLGATTYFTFKISTTPGAASGTPTCKIAPLGFTAVFSPTNKLCVKSPNIAALDYTLRFEEPATMSVPTNQSGQPLATAVASCKAISVKTYVGSMLDADTGDLLGTRYLQKGVAATWATQPWAVVGDDRGFWIIWPTVVYSTTVSQVWKAFYFGDGIPMGAVDPYCFITSGKLGFTANTDLLYVVPAGTCFNTIMSAPTLITPAFSFARSMDGVSQFASGWLNSQLLGYTNGLSQSSEFGYGLDRANGPEMATYAFPIYTFSAMSYGGGVTANLRGKMPGLYNHGFTNVSLPGLETMSGFVVEAGSPGRTFLLVRDCNTNATLLTSTAIDIIGPWGR